MGGIGKGHGGETISEVEIPFIIAGKAVKKNHEMKTSFVQYDNAATVAFALNLVRSSRMDGQASEGQYSKDFRM